MKLAAVDGFFFDDVHHVLSERAAKLAKSEIAAIEPAFARGEIDEDAAARRYLAVLAREGLLALCVPQAHGGPFPLLDLRSICVARERLSYESGFADTCFVLQGLGSHPITLAGSDLARTWLPRVGRGEAIAAFAVTEPDAGSDLAAAKTTARRDGDSWVIEGRKVFVSNAGIADFYTVLARSGDVPGAKGLSMFLVPASTPGVRVPVRLRVMAPHPIGTIVFEKARVPASHLLGEEGGGFALAMANLDFFRTSVGAAACGLAERAIDESIAHTKVRIQFGKPLAEQQLVRAALAEMATDLEASRLLVHRAAAMLDRGSSRVTAAASMAKLFATEAAQRIVDRGVQLHGGLGVTEGSVVERLYREVRALRIYEGASDIQKLVIAKQLLER